MGYESAPSCTNEDAFVVPETCEPTRSPLPSLPWRALSILTALNILSYMDRQLLALLALPIQDDLQISDVEVGLLQGLAFSVVYTLSSIPVGWAVDRWQRPWLIVGGVTIWSIATMGCGLARNYAQLLLCRMGVGAGEATLAPAAYAILAETTPRGRLGTAMGIYAVGASIGIALALAGGGLVVEALTGHEITVPLFGRLEAWQSAFLLVGLPGLLMAFTALLLPHRRFAPSPSVMQVSAPTSSFLIFLRGSRGAFISHLMGFSMLGLSGYAIAGWAPAHFGRNFGWSPGEIGPVLGLAVGLSGLVGTLLAANVADRRFRAGTKPAYYDISILTTLLGAPLIVTAFLVGDPWLSAGILGTGYMLLCSFGGSSTAALQLMTPARFRGRVGALYLFSVNIIGLGLGPLTVGLLTDHLFGDQAMVGRSVALTVAIAGAVTIACLIAGRAAHVRAIHAADAANIAP